MDAQGYGDQEVVDAQGSRGSLRTRHIYMGGEEARLLRRGVLKAEGVGAESFVQGLRGAHGCLLR